MKRLFTKSAFSLTLIIGLIIILRLPSLFEPYWYGDEGITLTVGQRWFLKELPYAAVYDNKPPLIYLIAGLANNLFGFKAIASIWVIVTVLVSYFFAKQIAKDLAIKPTSRPALVAGLVLGILLSLPMFEGNIVNGEILLILPVIAGAYLVYLNQLNRLPHWELVLIGAMFGVATLLKIPAIFDFLAMLIFITLFKIKGKTFNLKDYLLIVGGFVIVWLPFVGYFLANLTFWPFFRGVFLNNLDYVSAGNRFLTHFDKLILKTALFAFAITILAKNIKRLKAAYLLLSLWLISALFAALLAGRPYTHYLIQALPPISLLTTFILFEASPRKWLKLTALILGLTVIFVVGKFRIWSTASYYQNFISYALAGKSYSEYQAWFDPRTLRLQALANFLINESVPNDRLFVWGNEPDLYFLTKLKPAMPYITAYHLLSVPGAKTDGLNRLQAVRPEFVVTINNISEKYNELTAFIESNYQPVFNYKQEAYVWKVIKEQTLKQK